jgi:hypothetical protein
MSGMKNATVLPRNGHTLMVSTDQPAANDSRSSIPYNFLSVEVGAEHNNRTLTHDDNVNISRSPRVTASYRGMAASDRIAIFIPGKFKVPLQAFRGDGSGSLL